MGKTELEEPKQATSKTNGRAAKKKKQKKTAVSEREKETKPDEPIETTSEGVDAESSSETASESGEEVAGEAGNAKGDEVAQENDGAEKSASSEGAETSEVEPQIEKPKKPRRRRKKLDPSELAAYKRVVEGLLFSSREPVGASRLGSVIGDLTTADVRAVIELLAKDYKRQKRGVMIEEVGGGFRIVTVPELADAVRKLHRIRTEERLSAAALETLAIIAYRQPIIRADIEVIRGVACGGTLKWLMEKGLVKILGRAEVLGRPLLYGTTQGFLEQFGINHIKDLPRVDEFRAKTQ